MFNTLKQALQPWWVAVQFLTVLPVPRCEQASPSQLARSLLYYPLVGLLVGGLLLLTASLLMPIFSPLLLSALLLCLWVALTGGLHLDGLADCADAWVGGLGSRQRTLAIMKDPCSGPVAVSCLVLLLLLKFALVETLLTQQGIVWLMVVPVMGRMAAMLLLLSTAYVRQGGLAEILSRNLSRPQAWSLISIIAVAALWRWPNMIGAILCFSCAVFVLWRHLMLRRLGGCTGDTLGAMIEVVELASLLAIALVLGLGLT